VLTVMLPEQVITGGSVSVTVTENVQLELLPAASVAVHTTLVVPFGKLNPDAGTHTIEPPKQLSVKLAVKLTLVVHCPGAALTVMLSGQLGTGRSSSVTVTENGQLATPQPLEAVQFTVVEPTANAVPDAGVHTTVGEGVPEAFGANATCVEHWPGSAFVAILSGQVICGAALKLKFAAPEVADPQMLVTTAS
jgi:hypothetical protein